MHGFRKDERGARFGIRAVAVAALSIAPSLLVPLTADARTLAVEIEAVETPVGRLEDVAVELSWPAGADAGDLSLLAARVRAPGLGYAYENLRWSCRLTRTGGTANEAGGFACNGEVAAAGTRSGRLQLAYDGEGLDARLARGEARAHVRIGEARAIPVELQSLPADWLAPLLAGVWPEATLTGGQLDARLSVDPGHERGTRVEGTIAAHRLGVDTRDGRVATADLSAAGRLDLLLADRTELSTTLKLRGGELLAGALYAALPPSPVDLELRVAGGEGRWKIQQMHWRDGTVLALQAQAELDLQGQDWLRSAQVRADSADLAQANARYLGSLLGTLGLADVELAGALAMEFTIQDGRPVVLSAEPGQARIRDGQGRFAFEDLSGSLQWTRGGPAREGSLSWGSAALHGIALGAANLPLRSERGELALAAPAMIAVLGGELALQQLRWTPGFAEADTGTRAELALQLEGAELAALSRALDWPEFTGTLDARIPAARYRDGVLAFDGDLVVRVFDGTVTVGSLTMERPFGVAPTLAGDVALSNLDLEPMTAVFGFGTITGRLDGRIGAMRLVDWAPVAFDAALRTNKAAGEKRRISQRAVRDLSNVGGAGIAGGLQAGVLNVFDTFPYDAIGLSCRLENNVCRMGGLEAHGAGYLIVRGRGLPRITVIGHQRTVDWPVLVDRLQAATGGQAPVVR